MNLIFLFISSFFGVNAFDSWGHFGENTDYWKGRSDDERLPDVSRWLRKGPKERRSKDDIFDKESLRNDVLNIETNMMRYLYNICHYNSKLYPSIVEKGNQSATFYLALKALMEEKYGTRFSAPRFKKASQEAQERNVLLKKLKPLVVQFMDLVMNVLPLTSKPGQEFPKTLTDALEYYVYIVDIVKVKGNVKKLEDLIARHTRVSRNYYYPPFARWNAKETTAVDLSKQIADLQSMVSSLLGHIFDSYADQFEDIYPNLDKLLTQDPQSLSGAIETLQSLYGDIFENQKRKTGSLPDCFREEMVRYLTGSHSIIMEYWWKQMGLLLNTEIEIDGNVYVPFIQNFVKYVTVEELKDTYEKQKELVNSINGGINGGRVMYKRHKKSEMFWDVIIDNVGVPAAGQYTREPKTRKEKCQYKNEKKPKNKWRIFDEVQFNFHGGRYAY